MSRDRIVAISLLLVAAAGCGGESPPPEPYPIAIGRLPGVANPLSADASHAYAGRVGASVLPTVPSEVEDLRVWKQGDFVLANDRIAVVIEDAGPSDHFDPWGGKPVGVARVVGGQMVEPAQFNELVFGIGRYTVQTEHVGIVDDGSDGSAAVVRIVGRMAPIPFIDDTVRILFNDSYDGWWAAYDYVLEPGSEHVEVRGAFTNPDEAGPLGANPVMVLALQAYTMRNFTRDQGLGTPTGSAGWFGYVTPGATGYAVELRLGDALEDRTLQSGISIAGANVFLGPFHIFSGDPTEFATIARLHVGGPDVDGMARTMMRAEGITEREITGTVFESDGTTPAAGAEVHAQIDTQHYVTRATTDASGHYTLHVPAPSAVELYAFQRGTDVAGPVAVGTSQTNADLTMPAAGTLHVVIRDASTNMAMPGRVQIRPVGGEPSSPGSFGIDANGAGRVHQEWNVTGDASFRVAAGTHHVTVSRGFEYDILSTDVTIVAGQTLDLMAALSRDVATPNVMCGDFHLHTNRSPDAVDGVDRKLRGAAAEGLELPVRSDHEWTTDFEPAVARMGIGQWVYGLSSLELTTYWWGHFGVFPLAEQFDQPNGGSIQWYDAYSGPGYLHRTPIEVFDLVYARNDPAWGAPVIVVNHPRSTNTPVVGKAFAYFAAMGYDPVTGSWQDATHDERFQFVEAFNDSDFDANYVTSGLSATKSGTVNDWFSFLDRGIDIAVVGSSDSHGITDSPVGYPRTCIEVDTDDPDALRGMGNGPGFIRDRMLAGRVTVSGGVFVNAWARYSGGAGQGPGSTITGANTGGESVHVRVQAAPWVGVDRLRVFVNGALYDTIALDSSSPGYAVPATRYESDITIPIAATGRSYVVVVADGTQTMDEVYPRGSSGRRPFGVTNAIFFEP